MKKKLTIISSLACLSLLFVGVAQFVHADNEVNKSKRLCVFFNDGTIDSFDKDEVDSITTSIDDGVQKQHIWTKSKCVSYNVQSIDSISLVTMDYCETQSQYDEFKELFSKQDYDKAFEAIKEIADERNDSAEFALGVCYEYSLGTACDMEKAKEFYAAAAKQGNKEAKQRLEELSIPTNTVISFSPDCGINPVDIGILDNCVIRNVNGDCSYKSTSDKVLVMNKDNDLLYLSYRCKADNNSLTIDATETAVSLLLWSFPMAFTFQEEPVFLEIKSLIRELPETAELAKAIDKSIVDKGCLEIEQIESPLKTAMDALHKAIGFDVFDNLTKETTAAKYSAQRNIESDNTGTVIGPVDKKVTIKSGQYHYGVKTVLDEAIYDPDLKTWHCTFTVYNTNPIYLALVPGMIDKETGNISPKTDYALEYILKPQNASYIFDMAGVGGFSKLVEAQKNYWTDTYKMFKRGIEEGWSGFAEGMEEGYWNATHTTFKMDVSSPSDVMLVTSIDTDTGISLQLQAYTIVDLVIIPIFKQFIEIDDKKTLDKVYNVYTEYLLYKPSRLKELIEACTTDNLGKFTEIIKDIVDDVLQNKADEVVEGIIEDELFSLSAGGPYQTWKQYNKMYNIKDAAKGEIKAIEKALKAEKMAINIASCLLYASTFKSYYISFDVPEEETPSDNYINGHEYVDLGLPSGIKWATCNVGASKPEEYGDYFAWGETTTKSSYDYSNSLTYGKSIEELQASGIIGSDGNLTPAHDAATQNWGGSWRMPTLLEIEELIENTTTEEATSNGVKGCLVKSKRNGNSIFIPASGCRYGAELSAVGGYGNCWSSSPDGGSANGAYGLYFGSGYFGMYWDYRSLGQSVRPVSE